MLIGQLYAIAGALTWAFSGVFLTRIHRKVHISAIGAVRCGISALFFGLLIPLSGGLDVFRAVNAQHILMLMLVMVISLGLGDSLFIISARRIGMVRAMPICMSYPLFTSLLAGIFLEERIAPLVVAGALSILGGTYLLSSGPRAAPATSESLDPLGLFLAVLTALLWAAASVIMTPVSKDIHPVALNVIRQSAGSIMFVLVMPKALGKRQLRDLGNKEWGILLAGGLLGSGIGAMLYVLALRIAGASITSVLTAASPAFSTPLSVALLGERVNPRLIFGTIVIIAGVILVIFS